LLAALLLSAIPGSGRCADDAAAKGAYLGVLFSPTPEGQFAHDCYRLARPFLGGLARHTDALAAHFSLPGVRGVVVTQVLPDSPAARTSLKRGDILLRYNEVSIRSCQHFAHLIQTDKPDHKVKLLVRRNQTEQTVEATLALGPALRIAPAYSTGKPGPGDGPRATAKPQSSVSVAAAPLEGGKLKVVIEYYQDGKPASVTCQGDAAAIRTTLNRDLPEPQRNLALAALERLLFPSKSRLDKTSPTRER
jgi:hypothetical protein